MYVPSLTDALISEADGISAVLDSDIPIVKIKDRIEVFSRHDKVEPSRPFGQPHYRLKDYTVPIHSVDELPKLRARIEGVRGNDGIVSREDRKHRLFQLGPYALTHLYKKRMGIPAGNVESGVIGDFIEAIVKAEYSEPHSA